jgi:hypothetical protein
MVAHIWENAVSSALLPWHPRPHRQYLKIDLTTLVSELYGRMLGWVSNAASSSRLVVPVFDMDW